MYYVVSAVKDEEIFVKVTEGVESALDSHIHWCFAKASVIEFFIVDEEIKYYGMERDSIFSATLSEFSKELTLVGENAEIEKRLRLHRKFYVEEI